MALIEVNWNPDDRELRRFGWIAVAASVVIAIVLHVLKGLDVRWCAVIVAAGSAVGLSAWVSLKVTRAVYRILVGATLPIGLTISLLLLSLFYFGDPLRRRSDAKARTYWLAHPSPGRPERYFQQF